MVETQTVQELEKEKKQTLPLQEAPVRLDDIVSGARKLSVHDKLILIRILVDDLIREELLAPLRQERTIDMWTPYNSFGAGHVLAEERAKMYGETVESIEPSHVIQILDPQFISK